MDNFLLHGEAADGAGESGIGALEPPGDVVKGGDSFISGMGGYASSNIRVASSSPR